MSSGTVSAPEISRWSPGRDATGMSGSTSRQPEIAPCAGLPPTLLAASPVIASAAGYEIDCPVDGKPRLRFGAAGPESEPVTAREGESGAVRKTGCAFEPREEIGVERHLHNHPAQRPAARDHFDAAAYCARRCGLGGSS